MNQQLVIEGKGCKLQEETAQFVVWQRVIYKFDASGPGLHAISAQQKNGPDSVRCGTRD